MDKQFDDYLVGEGLDPDAMTQEEKDAKKDAYTQALYPGAVASPDSMVYIILFTTSESPKYSNPPIFCCLQNFVFFLIKSRAKYWNHATFSNSDSMGVQLKALKYVIQYY